MLGKEHYPATGTQLNFYTDKGGGHPGEDASAEQVWRKEAIPPTWGVGGGAQQEGVWIQAPGLL